MTTTIKKQQLRKENWINSSLYPFASNYIQLESGKMHYIDEGVGETILFIHGTPTWSFLYRNQIKHLSKRFRCIAPDHLGFGLSEKPFDFDGTPESHAKNLEAFVDHLNLKKFTLVVHDFGGPIGLSYAIKHPEKIKNIVLFNTWLWETKSNPGIQKIDKMIRNWLGKFLYLNMNFSPKVLLKKGFYNKKLLAKTIHQHYLNPFPNKDSRLGLLKIAKSLLGSSDWYQALWEQLHKISNKPFLILWGKKDEFITPEFLKKWKQHLHNFQAVEFECGHFVQEEKAKEVSAEMENFITNLR
jgi:haloalkane dehalogenase